MGGKRHQYSVDLKWVGNQGTGTKVFDAYSRNHILSADQKSDILASSDPAFMGDDTRWNPEETLVGSIAACHKLWYLHLCYSAGVNVVEYEDTAKGQMSENQDGSGQFDWVHLYPRVLIDAESDANKARSLHGDVGAVCFIARSVNFIIHHTPTILKQKG